MHVISHRAHTHTHSPAARPMPGNGRRKLCEDSTTDERWICNESFVDFHLIYLLRSSTPFCCSFISGKNENIFHFTDPKCVHFANSATLRLNDVCIPVVCVYCGKHTNNSKYEHISSSAELLHVHRCEHRIELTNITQLPHTYIYWNVRRHCFPYAIRIFIVSKRNELKPSLHLLVPYVPTRISCGT